MSRARTAALLKAILTGQAGLSGVSDADLLRRFSNDNDQAAFAGLLRRHRGMVLGVCRRGLPNLQDAEDACQATFLILARKARSHNRWQASVANWLYATARKVSRNARVAAQRRARRKARAAVPEAVQPVDTMSGRELLAALDEELERLPAALPCGAGSVLSGRADAGGSRRPAGRACRDDQDPSRAWPETPGRCLDRPWLCFGSGTLDASRHVLGAGVDGTNARKCLGAVAGSPRAAVAVLAKRVAVQAALRKLTIVLVASLWTSALALGSLSLMPATTTAPDNQAMPAKSDASEPLPSGRRRSR